MSRPSAPFRDLVMDSLHRELSKKLPRVHVGPADYQIWNPPRGFPDLVASKRSEIFKAFSAKAFPYIEYEMTSETERTEFSYVTTYVWTPKRNAANFAVMASIDEIRQRLGAMTEDEIREAMAGDPAGLARIYEQRAAEMDREAARATTPAQRLGLEITAKSFRKTAAELRGAADPQT